jgi:hypothetical protein
MTVQISQYTSLITSEHQSAPNFMAMVSLLAQWAADRQNMLASIPGLYDIDDAVGSQLDAVGLWVGASRDLSIPLTDVYFSFDEAGLGFDQGTWLGPFDPTSGLVALPDAQYRILLYATIAANNWDGTIPGAYNAWNTIFEPLGYSILIQDNQDMTMDIALIGPAPDAVTLALFTGGYLSLVPAGVGITNYYLPSIPGDPVFGMDAENSSISGFDVGAWAIDV